MRYLLLLPLLAACTPYSSDNHGFGWDIDYITPLGIEVRVDVQGSTVSAEIIDEQYTLMSECLGYNVQPANLMIVLTDQAGVNTVSGSTAAIGSYISRPNLAVIRNFQPDFEYLVLAIIRHELIHYIYRRETGSADPEHNNLNDYNYETCTYQEV